jgi:hypothetical protein
MNNRIDNRTAAHEAHRRLAAESLKRCPLCGAVNARANGECFVCRWAGGFDHNPEHVEEGLTELLTRCPELADVMIDAPSRIERIRAWVRRTIARIGGHRVDVYA